MKGGRILHPILEELARIYVTMARSIGADKEMLFEEAMNVRARVEEDLTGYIMQEVKRQRERMT